MIIGLTGQSGAGKSEASKVFKDKCFFVIDADKTAKEVYNTEPECVKKLQDEFGKHITLYGEIDRKKLASIVFSSKEALNKLNKIVLPYIVKQVHIQIKNAKTPYILLDAPLLFESGLGDICSYTIGILAPYSQREKRILKRDSLKHGINVIIEDNKISLDFHVIVSYGVSILAVADNLISNVKYKVEQFTGMQVENINILVEGVRVID